MEGTPFFDVLKCTMSLPVPDCESKGFRCEALPETTAVSAKPGGSGKRKRNAATNATAAIDDGTTEQISLAPDSVNIEGKGWVVINDGQGYVFVHWSVRPSVFYLNSWPHYQA